MISKKDLLKSMNISYGQLYRWKREGLIPDEWFVKQSVSTGQETYFDETLIIPRIQKILDLKDDYQFEEMKSFFVSTNMNNYYDVREALSINSIDPYFLKIYLKERKDVNINELAILHLLSKYDNLLNSIDYLKNDYRLVSCGMTFNILLHNDEYFMIICNDISYLDQKFKVVITEQLEDIVSLIAKELKEGK